MGQGIISRSNPGNSGDKVGDIRITTRNTLGEKWALCNGDPVPADADYKDPNSAKSFLDPSTYKHTGDLKTILNLSKTNETILSSYIDSNGVMWVHTQYDNSDSSFGVGYRMYEVDQVLGTVIASGELSMGEELDNINFLNLREAKIISDDSNNVYIMHVWDKFSWDYVTIDESTGSRVCGLATGIHICTVYKEQYLGEGTWFNTTTKFEYYLDHDGIEVVLNSAYGYHWQPPESGYYELQVPLTRYCDSYAYNNKLFVILAEFCKDGLEDGVGGDDASTRPTATAKFNLLEISLADTITECKIYTHDATISTLGNTVSDVDYLYLNSVRADIAANDNIVLASVYLGFGYHATAVLACNIDGTGGRCVRTMGDRLGSNYFPVSKLRGGILVTAISDWYTDFSQESTGLIINNNKNTDIIYQIYLSTYTCGNGNEVESYSALIAELFSIKFQDDFYIMTCNDSGMWINSYGCEFIDFTLPEPASTKRTLSNAGLLSALENATMGGMNEIDFAAPIDFGNIDSSEISILQISTNKEDLKLDCDNLVNKLSEYFDKNHTTYVNSVSYMSTAQFLPIVTVDGANAFIKVKA